MREGREEGRREERREGGREGEKKKDEITDKLAMCELSLNIICILKLPLNTIPLSNFVSHHKTSACAVVKLE